jgi:hypothetical protein
MLSLSKWLINKSMEELYRYVHIPNFEEIQRELIESINYDYSSQGLHAQNFTEEYMTEKCPKLMNWLKVKSKSENKSSGKKPGMTPPNPRRNSFQVFFKRID